MSLIFFHRLLIATAILFCLGFAVWEFLDYRENGAVTALLLGLAFAVAGIALIYYLRHLKRFLRLSGDNGEASR